MNPSITAVVMFVLLLSALFPGLVYRYLRDRGARSYAPDEFTPFIAAGAWSSLWMSQLHALLALTLSIVFAPIHQPSLLLWAGVLAFSYGLFYVSRGLLEVGVQLLVNGRERFIKVASMARNARRVGLLIGVPAALNALYWISRKCHDTGCIVKGVMIFFSAIALAFAGLWLLYGLILRRTLSIESTRA